MITSLLRELVICWWTSYIVHNKNPWYIWSSGEFSQTIMSIMSIDNHVSLTQSCRQRTPCFISLLWIVSKSCQSQASVPRSLWCFKKRWIDYLLTIISSSKAQPFIVETLHPFQCKLRIRSLMYSLSTILLNMLMLCRLSIK